MHDNLKAVIAIAREVGQVVLPYFSHVLPDIKQDGSWITQADHVAHELLTRHLAQLIDLPVLSEELRTEAQQEIISNAQQSYWCIDPIDGTSNFALGIPYWCISIALIIDADVQLAVVYDPNRDEVFSALSDEPSQVNGTTIEKSFINHVHDATALIDLKRIPQRMVADLCAQPPYRSQRSLGASALELAWVAAGRCQLYLHGGQNLWDHAAAIKIVHNAGGCASRFDGQSLLATQLEPQSIIAASDVSLFNEWHHYLKRFKT